MRKHWGLFLAFFRASLTADLEFRANFVTRIVTDIFWYAAQIFTFEVLYLYTDQIGDWTRDQTRVFLGVLFVVDAIYMILFSQGLDNLSETVRKGTLDLLLTKPVNSQFIVSLQRIATANLGNLVLGAAWLFWSLSKLEDFHWPRVVWLFIAIPSGAVIVYGLKFTFSATAVIFTRAENLQYLWYHLYKLGMRPDNIYVPWLKMVILTFLPVGLIASVPSRLVLNTANHWLLIWVLFVAGVVLYASTRMWKFTLRKYTSASS